MDKVEVTIIIPTKNGGNDIENCLSGVFKQKTRYSYEVIVIDSGSRDNTLEIVERFPVRLIKIKPEEFGHGKTRNLGGGLAKGRYLVYLTQDAIPANVDWLENLVDNFEDEKVAGVYSRWFMKQNCNPLEARYVFETFKPIKEIRSLDGVSNEDYSRSISGFILFSNVSSCIRKNIWEKIPFDDTSIFGEDQEWSQKALKAGYTIVYEPQSIVYHSHNHSLRTQFKTSFDDAISFKGIIGMKTSLIGLLFLPVLATATAFKDYQFMKRNRVSNKAKWVIYSMITTIVRGIASWLGAHHEYIPKGLRRKFSTVPHVLEDGP